MGRFDGKVVLITGAAHGQGRSHAVMFAREGADVIAVDVDRPTSDKITYPMGTTEELQETARMVEAFDRRIVTGTADVRDYAALQAVVDRGVAELGPIDIVSANAGVITYNYFQDITEDEWDVVFDTNVKGVWNTLRAAVPSMIAAGRGGSIILTSSAAGIRGQVVYMHYTASKHAVVGIMKTASNELARHKIRVNSVHPAAVNTFIGRDPSPQDFAAREPMMLTGGTNTLEGVWSVEPEDVSEAVLFLASDAARFITGTQLTVDAGNTTKP
jgi:SDR family mycofactocin-dependent oxidoreductase